MNRKPDAPTVRIRPADKEDLPTLNRISVASKKHWGYPEEWLEKWRADLTLTEAQVGEGAVRVLEIDRRAAGFCSIVEQPGYYEVVHLWLLPEYIGKGYGKWLLQQTIEAAAEHPKPILVEADPHAEVFYRSQGFATFDRVESYPPGRFLPVMRREPG